MSNIVPVSEIARMADAVAKSGLFGIRTPDQAMALMLIAQAEGLHPAIAARDYHVINGRPTLKADAMLARFQQAGGTVKWIDYTDTKCSAVISHPQGGSVEVTWTLVMANNAGLTKNPTWKSYPRQMLRARVISEGIRTVFPGVAVGVYTPEEAEDYAAKPTPQAQTVDMGKAEIVEDDALTEFETELFARIAGAKTLADLEALRPGIRDLTPNKKKLALAKAQAQGAVIRSQPVDTDYIDANETDEAGA